jgi:hypothetical protein
MRPHRRNFALPTSVAASLHSLAASGEVQSQSIGRGWTPAGVAPASRKSSIFLRRIGGVVFMRVNSKCAHPVRPPLTGTRGDQVRASWGAASMKTVSGTCNGPRLDETPGASRGGGRWQPSGIHPGLRKIDQNPHSSRWLGVRFGTRWRARRKTISCCVSRRFSAITARTRPEPQNFAVTMARCSRASRRFLTCGSA